MLREGAVSHTRPLVARLVTAEGGGGGTGGRSAQFTEAYYRCVDRSLNRSGNPRWSATYSVPVKQYDQRVIAADRETRREFATMSARSL